MTRQGKVLAREVEAYLAFWEVAREGGPAVAVAEPRPSGRFVVVENTPGYMPENDDPAVFDTEDEAWAYLVEEVTRYVEHLHEVEVQVTVRSFKEFGYVEVEDGGLGRVFYINSEEGCDG